MPPFENDPSKPLASAGPPQHEASAAPGPSAEAEGSAAKIAELVRRTSERQSAGASCSSAARTEVTIAEPQPQAVAPTTPPAETMASPSQAERPHVTKRPPSLRVLVAGGAIAGLLLAGGVALSLRDGSAAAPPTTTANQAPALAKAAPAGFAEKVTDVITDCAGHSHGRTRASFREENCLKATRTLGSGQVGGRPVLFVVSRIEMASGEAATSVKAVLDDTGTGNLNDLLREGKTFPGAPGGMPDSGYASLQSGAVILVAEAGFSDGGASASSDPALRSAAAARVAAMVATTG